MKAAAVAWEHHRLDNGERPHPKNLKTCARTAVRRIGGPLDRINWLHAAAARCAWYAARARCGGVRVTHKYISTFKPQTIGAPRSCAALRRAARGRVPVRIHTPPAHTQDCLMLEKLWHVLLGEPVVMPPPAAYNAQLRNYGGRARVGHIKCTPLA